MFAIITILPFLLVFQFWVLFASPLDVQVSSNTNSTLSIESSFTPVLPPRFITQSHTSGSLRGSVLLYNGKIHTIGPSNRVVSILAVRDGYIAYTGDDLPEAERTLSQSSSPFRKINLRRRVAVPGLIDCHNHIVLLGNRPGYHTPLELSLSVADVKATYQQRAKGVPKDGWITTIGGFSPNQLKEQRLPTLEELDSAVNDNPIFISTSFSGPATTNTKGREILEREASVVIATNGSIASGLENGKALLWLRQSLLGFEERKRSVRSAMEYAASVGVTTHVGSSCDICPLTFMPRLHTLPQMLVNIIGALTNPGHQSWIKGPSVRPTHPRTVLPQKICIPFIFPGSRCTMTSTASSGFA